MENLIAWWDALVAQYATRTAVVGADQRATYAELSTYIDAVAQTLSERGVRSGVKVALFFPNQPDFLVAFFAVLKAGGVPCPINANLTPFELDPILTLLEPSFAIAGTIAPTTQAQIQQKLPVMNLSLGQLQGVEALQHHDRSSDSELEDVACILCTSGTTGLPKAVMLTHTNLLSNTHALWLNKQWRDAEIFGNSLPVFHIYGLTVLTLLPLSMGGTVVYMPPFTPESCLQTIEQEKITRFGGVPSMYTMLSKFRKAKQFDFSSCLSWISGGAALPRSVAEVFTAKYGGLIYEGYGMLETSPGISWNLDDRPYHVGSVGRLLKGVTVEIRDEQGQPVKLGDAGEIWVKGPGVMKGFYRNPIATSEAIHNGYLNTGDIGRLDADGYLYLMGRKKEVMIVGGHNVYPKEVETVLLADAAIGDAAVAALEDPMRGEQVLAFVVPAANAEVDEQELISQCRQSLSSFKVPRRIYTVDQIPRNDSGKILRQQLLASVN